MLFFDFSFSPTFTFMLHFHFYFDFSHFYFHWNDKVDPITDYNLVQPVLSADLLNM